MELAVNALRALADPMRLRIVYLLLGESELCVCQLTAVLGVNYAALSKHLQLLKLVGMVADEKRGRWVYYHLNRESWNPAVSRLVECVRDLAEHDPASFEQDRHAANRVACCSLADVARLGPAFLRGRVMKGKRTGVKRVAKKAQRAGGKS